MVATHERKAKSYSATAEVAFQSGTLSEAGLQVTPSGSSEPQREVNTEVLIAHSTEVARRWLGSCTSQPVPANCSKT